MDTRARRGILLLTAAACLSLAGHLAYIACADDPGSRWPARVDDYDRVRYAGLDDVLPPRGVVGYLDDGDKDIQGYYLTQYALVPRVLVEDATRPLLLVNGRPGQAPALGDAPTLIGDLGNGVRVYRRGRP